ncbi:tRNA (N6-isopentenyl adenosine(37)-C2)-methylthiotransferase MiaB [Candidatus Dependentiae bacterium]
MSKIKVFFKTYGCQANVADSQDFAQYLLTLGVQGVDCKKDADLVIVNTCAIREKAESKIYSYLGELVELKEPRPYMKFGVIGCVASYRKKEIFQRFDHINFVCGAREKTRLFKTYLSKLVQEIIQSKQDFESGKTKTFSGRQDRDMEAFIKSSIQKETLPVKAVKEICKKPELKRAMINIMTGCNNYCTYCIVPFTRGRERSYPFESIVERVRGEVEVGAKEITLIGQNVNSYKDPVSQKSFPELLEAVAKIPGDFWIRYVSPHPKDITRELLDVMAKYPKKVCPAIHFPLQSGSTKILQAMNRTYSAEKFMDGVKMIREVLFKATISTDIIVGFPGETEEDYLATRDVMEKSRFDMVYSFIYSPRKYTKAAEMTDECPDEVKTKRLMELQERAREMSREQHEKLVDDVVVRVLVEGRLSGGKLWGKTAGNVRVRFNGPDEAIGTFVNVKIVAAQCAYVEAEGV